MSVFSIGKIHERSIYKKISILFFILVVLTGCAKNNPKEDIISNPKEFLVLKHETEQEHKLQTRRFDTIDEDKIFTATQNVLKDFGYVLEESDKSLGVVTGAKRGMTVTGTQVLQTIGSTIINLLTPSYLYFNTPSDDAYQMTKVSIIINKNSVRGSLVRVTFQRVISISNATNRGVLRYNTKFITEEKEYKNFFENLSKVLGLEAHEI